MLSTEVQESRKLNLNNLSVSLPSELLREIFIVLVGSQVAGPNSYFRSTAMHLVRKTRLVICQVCHIWRMTAIDTKLIWAIIGFPHGLVVEPSHPQAPIPLNSVSSSLSPPTNDSWDDDEGIPAIPKISPRSLHLIEEDLERSGDSPISLYLYSKDASGNAMILSPSIVREITRTAQSLLHRCRHIQFDSNCIEVSALFETPHPLPELHSLFGTINQELFPISVVDLTSAPQLRYLRLFTFQLLPRRGESQLELKLGEELLLARLELQGFHDYYSVISLLNNAPQLEELKWEEKPYPNLDHNPNFLPPTIPALQSLRHIVLRGTNPLSILGSLQSSQLLRLEINYPHNGLSGSIWSSQIRPLSDPSQFPALRILLLKGEASTALREETDITHFIEAHPQLEVLSLPSHITESLAKAIAYVPAIRYVKAMRQRGDDAGVISLGRAWMQREQEAAPETVHSSSSSHTLPVLHLVTKSASAVDAIEDDNLSSLPFIVFDDWRFISWQSVDWDEFLSVSITPT